MGAVEDHFSAHGWPKNGEDARVAKAVVEAAQELKRTIEKSKRLLGFIKQAEYEARLGRYDAAVEKLKEGMEQT